MQPWVGQLVHYVSEGTPILADGTQKYPSACIAAVVTEIDPENPDRVGLTVFNPSGLFWRNLSLGGCVQSPSELRRGGTWHGNLGPHV